MKTSLWLVPLLVLVMIAPLSSMLDLKVSSWFYVDEAFSQDSYWKMIRDVGVIPGMVLAVGSLICYLIGFIFPSFLKTFQQPALFLALVLLLGSGIITHLIIKDHWGRPRPRQITAFGGDQPFRPFYEPHFSETRFKSLPCGHCTMGFYFLAVLRLGVVFRKRWLVISGYTMTIFLGGALSLARLAQGGHFFSDVLVSFCVMWWTTLFLEWTILRERTH